MLIRLHDKCYVNPLNVAAVICGQMAVTVRLTNGRAHNIECRGKNSCPQMYGNIVNALMFHIDMIPIATREIACVNVDHVLSISASTPGVTLNMAGDWTLIIPCGMSSQIATLRGLVQTMETFK